FVSPSRHESYGLTTMEAMSEGTPAIAIDTPGARQTIQKKTGIIVSRQEPIAPELWKNIYSVLTNKNYNLMLSEEAKKWATRENFANAAEHILRVMEEVRLIC
ncbi:glycosyltransferase, partial [bacterium]|nr:glycosyltransferase [bacterium]